MKNLLDEEEIIKILWTKIGPVSRRDPFDDDAAWVSNNPNRLVVAKSDMLVAATDAPSQMTPAQIARKSVVSCVSDFASKGVRPSFCLVSLGLPRRKTTREVIESIAAGFQAAQKEYSLRIIGGDTNETAADQVIDCTLLGFSRKLVKRSGARPGHCVGVSGSFGLQAAGLLLLQGKARTKDIAFSRRAIDSVLNPRARLDVGLKASKSLSSCIDSSDGLALSLYHLAESGGVGITLDKIPIASGIDNFAIDNKVSAGDLALFGGEEFELVCTFDPKYAAHLSRLGITIIGKVERLPLGESSLISYNGKKVMRRGWMHFKS